MTRATTAGRHTAGEDATLGRLLARPTPVTPGTPASPAGVHPLGLGAARDGLLYLPRGHHPARPAPLVLLLHGAGGDARHGLAPLLPLADAAGLILLAPDARRETWDVIRGGYGPDVAFIDRALATTFARYAADPARVVAAGFSDGASYALSIGLANGDLFTHVAAFSPGFVAAGGRRGAPGLFVAHGTRDDVLPIDACSRRIVPRLRRDGYAVHYHEFDGPHAVPPEVARAALDWFTSSPG